MFAFVCKILFCVAISTQVFFAFVCKRLSRSPAAQHKFTQEERKLINFQPEKETVLDFYQALDRSDSNLSEVFERYTSDDYSWRGYYPFGELNKSECVALFWKPLRASFQHLQRRQDIFFAGQNEIDGFNTTWVVSMGHLMGLLDEPWLNINPTGKMVFLRYCEFHRVEQGKILESSLYFDLPHLMIQAGMNPFPNATGQHLIQPGPMTHDGLLFKAQDTAQGQHTLRIINQMINQLGQWQSKLSLEDELRQSWSDNMIWWGPAGIGASYTIERYAKQHSAPFRAGLTDRSKTQHIARLAEGNYGGFFGWPNFTARSAGGFMGMPESKTPGEFRVIDIYRREGEQLVENWVFIDLLHFWITSGVELNWELPVLR